MTRVFISSTSQDLSDYRTAAEDVCLRQGMFPQMMEHFAAMSAGATAGSRQKLEGCELYVGIYAHRYGYIEPGYDRSVTELEFDYASDKKIDRLCFVIDPQYEWPYREEVNADKLQAFKARVERLIRAQFTDISDFKFKLLQSLNDWEKRRNALRPDPVWQPLAYGPGPSHQLSFLRRLIRASASLRISSRSPRVNSVSSL